MLLELLGLYWARTDVSVQIIPFSALLGQIHVHMSQTLAPQRFSPTIQSGTPKARLLIFLGILSEWHTLQEEASAIFMLDLTTRSTL